MTPYDAQHIYEVILKLSRSRIAWIEYVEQFGFYFHCPVSQI